ncbi:hypothetical protein MRX96_009099 [Rhipicephalus microplus]
MKAALILAVFFVIAYADPPPKALRESSITATTTTMTTTLKSMGIITDTITGTITHTMDPYAKTGLHEVKVGRDLPDASLAQVVGCVVQNVSAEIREKLEGVKDGLQCDSILCGIKKFCERDGTLENNRTDVFTHEQNAELRSAFMGCRPQQVGTSQESVQHATEATAEA